MYGSVSLAGAMQNRKVSEVIPRAVSSGQGAAVCRVLLYKGSLNVYIYIFICIYVYYLQG